MFGLRSHYHSRAELQTAHALGERLLTLAQQAQGAAMLMAAHRALGATLFWMGAVAAADTHFAQGIALYDPQQHRASALLYGEDAGVICYSLAAWALWFLGYPDQGLARSQEAVTLAQQSAHPFSLVNALSFVAVLHQLRREEHTAQECAEAAISVATDQEFPYWRAYSSLSHGWARVHQGQGKEEIEQMYQSMQAFRTTGAELARPYFLALLAEAHGAIGQPEAGLMVRAEDRMLTGTPSVRWYESEMYRLKGELLLQQHSGNQAEVESCFAQAIAIAQNQSAKSWELRATSSLARLWKQQGKRQEAHDLLASVYHWF